MEEIIIESCHSTWIIDMENSRFRRVVKGSSHHATPASTEWQACYGVEIDPLSESFVVLLNPEGTRLLRSWRHVEHCSQCGGEATSELSRETSAQQFAGRVSLLSSKASLRSFLGMGSPPIGQSARTPMGRPSIGLTRPCSVPIPKA